MKMPLVRPRRFAPLALALVALITIIAVRRVGSSGALPPDTRARLDALCLEAQRQPGNQDAAVCQPATRHSGAIAQVTSARALLDDARAALATGDPTGARRALERALSTARELPRRERLLGGLLGASVVRDVLDLLDAEPAAFDRATRRELLAQAEVADVGAVIAADHAQWLWMYAQPDTADADALVAGLDGDGVVLAGMTRALTQGDLAACQRSTDAIVPADRRAAMRVQCKSLTHLAQTRARLERTRLALN
ncbi:MAG: hypothetical protein K8W52_45770 [Deltaproteobacteria bacterium]|nr:hypothetical protein [Deltaproteobacteria bacterium]